MDRITKIVKHSMFSGSFLMIGGSLGVNVVNYLYHLLMGRILGPKDYGVLGAVFSLFYIVSIIPMSGSFAIVKFISSAKNEKERASVYVSLKKFIYRLAIVSALVVIFLSPLLSKFLHIENVLNIFLVGPTLFVSLITLVNQATLQGILEFWGIVGPNLVSSLGKLVLGIFFIAIGFQVFGAVLGVFISVAMAFILSEKLISKHFRHKSANDFKIAKFLHYAFPVLLQALAFTLIFTLDLILVKHFLSESEAGLYAALSTLGKIVFFATQPVSGVMFPMVSKKKSLGENYRRIFFLSCGLTIFISVLVTFFYAFLPELSIKLLYGPEYLTASPNLVWMGIFMALYTLCYLVVNFLLAIGKVRVVILPLLAALAQAVGIYYFHNVIFSVIRVSILSMLFLAFSLFSYVLYNRLKVRYV